MAVRSVKCSAPWAARTVSNGMALDGSVPATDAQWRTRVTGPLPGPVRCGRRASVDVAQRWAGDHACTQEKAAGTRLIRRILLFIKM